MVGLISFLTPPSAHDRVVTQAIAYGVLCAGVALWALADLARDPHPALRRHGLPISLATVTAAGCVGSTAGSVGYVMIAFSAVALMAAAELLPAPAWLAIAALGIVATEVGGVVFSQDIGVLAGSPLLLAVGVSFGRNRASLRVQAEQARQLLAQHEQLRAEQRRAEVLQERARIAREIHDVLAHSLGALGIQLQTIRALITVHNDTDRALEALAAAQGMASSGLSDTRRAVLALRTDTLPLHDELARATTELAELHQARVGYRFAGPPVALPPEATVAMTRIAQESLVNAVKHAPGAEITVDLDYRDDHVALTVSNPLVRDVPGPAGALRTADAGYGLTGMRERLALLGGTLEAGPHDGRWVVVADLPLPAAAGPSPAPPATPSSAAVPASRETDR